MIDDYDEDELYYGFIEEEQEEVSNKLELPAFIREYVTSAVDVSKYNHVPAALTAFVLLGQLSKDMVCIVGGKRREDTRIPFLWMQTSGSGKTEMYNFFGPVARKTFEILQSRGNYFDIFDVKEITDAALIGSMKQEEQTIEGANGPERVYVDVQIKGALEGDGLIVYDEFEYSGVFKQSQHKENVVMYLMTLMNTLWGENWVITKKLKDGDTVLECRCQRSAYATSYIPKMLTSVIAEKGIMQRMLIFIWEVPQSVQDEIRKSVLEEFGTKKDNKAPIDKFARGFAKIHETLKERYEDVDRDPTEVITYSNDFNAAIIREYESMRKYVESSRAEVLEIASNFITRLNNHLVRLSILCCIAEAPSITDKSKRFVVTSRNVSQAGSLVKQCYKSLVSWLDTALRVERRTLQDKANVNVFKQAYDELNREGSDGFVNKTILIGKVRSTTKKGESTIYKWWQKISDNFEEKRIAKKVYVKWNPEE